MPARQPRPVLGAMPLSYGTQSINYFLITTPSTHTLRPSLRHASPSMSNLFPKFVRNVKIVIGSLEPGSAGSFVRKS